EKDNLEKLIRHLVQYKTIKVYHGKYKTVVTQDSVVTDISAGTDTSDVENTNEDYIFEPSIEDILMFFETQVFTSLFDQVLRESQLARYASRILAMDSASANISNRIKEARIERLMAIHKEINKKQ